MNSLEPQVSPTPSPTAPYDPGIPNLGLEQFPTITCSACHRPKTHHKLACVPTYSPMDGCPDTHACLEAGTCPGSPLYTVSAHTAARPAPARELAHTGASSLLLVAAILLTSAGAAVRRLAR